MVKFGDLPCMWCKYEDHGVCNLTRLRLNDDELIAGCNCSNWRTKTKSMS